MLRNSCTHPFLFVLQTLFFFKLSNKFPPLLQFLMMRCCLAVDPEEIGGSDSGVQAGPGPTLCFPICHLGRQIETQVSDPARGLSLISGIYRYQPCHVPRAACCPRHVGVRCSVGWNKLRPVQRPPEPSVSSDTTMTSLLHGDTQQAARVALADIPSVDIHAKCNDDTMGWPGAVRGGGGHGAAAIISSPPGQVPPAAGPATSIDTPARSHYRGSASAGTRFLEF